MRILGQITPEPVPKFREKFRDYFLSRSVRTGEGMTAEQRGVDQEGAALRSANQQQEPPIPGRLFVALSFPSWMRWGQRRGAFVDHLALAAIYPDHRRYERYELDGAWTSRLIGSVYRCGWCGAVCPGRRSSWCSEKCSALYYRVWGWRGVSKYAAERDGYRCVRCRRDFTEDGAALAADGKWKRHYLPWECDHIRPVRNGGTDDPANLRTLCHDCHVAVGYEQRAAELPVDAQLTLEPVA